MFEKSNFVWPSFETCWSCASIFDVVPGSIYYCSYSRSDGDDDDDDEICTIVELYWWRKITTVAPGLLHVKKEKTNPEGFGLGDMVGL